MSDIETLPIVNRNATHLNESPNQNSASISDKLNAKVSLLFSLLLTSLERYEIVWFGDSFKCVALRLTIGKVPMKQFRKYARDAFEDDQLSLLQRTNPKGEWQLRQEIAHYLFNLSQLPFSFWVCTL